MISMRRAAAIGIALGLGVGAMTPALANWDHRGDHSPAWGLNVTHNDGPAWGLTNTDHGPAFGVDTHGRDFSLPIVLPGDVAGDNGWAKGLSAFGIDDATITGDNPVADAYLGQAGGSNATHGWTNDRGGWLGGLLGDGAWNVGGRF